MNITVYLGASEGMIQKWHRQCRNLALGLGQSGKALIYGGSEEWFDGKTGEKCASSRR